MRGKLFVVSGPSGVGKNTLLNAVVARSVHVRYSISATSRAMRPGEVDGKSYYFVTREQFEKLIADDALLEYAEYVGNYYGTPLQPIREAIEAGTDIVMVDGVLYLDTGYNGTYVTGDTYDREITSAVQGYEQPTENDQSNFGTGYKYRYGKREGTIEIEMNSLCRIFATEAVRQQIQFPNQ